jgi:hypothetical protein
MEYGEGVLAHLNTLAVLSLSEVPAGPSIAFHIGT